MIISEKNLKIVQHPGGLFEIRIMLPDNSGNYLHHEKLYTINDALIEYDLLNTDIEIYAPDITIKEDEKYFRIILKLQNANNDTYIFHSRKLNYLDVMQERNLLLSIQ